MLRQWKVASPNLKCRDGAASFVPLCLIGHTRNVAILLIAMGCATSAAADTLGMPRPSKPVAEMSIEELMQVQVATVTTASKTPEKATDTPGTTLVIDARDIQLRGYSTLKDVLRDLPGMETTEQYFSEIGTNVPVRGIVGNNTIILLINGMRVNPPGGEFLPIHTDVSVREAEQIEIVYGPGSTLYGQDAISAVINIKTKTYAKPTGDFGINAGMYNSREAWFGGGANLDQSGKSKISGFIQTDTSSLNRLDKDFPAYWDSFRKEAVARGQGAIPWRTDRGLNAFARIDLGGNTSLQVWRRQSLRSSAEGYTPVLGYLDVARWGDISTVGELKHTVKLSEQTRLDSTLTANEYRTDPENEYVPLGTATTWNLGDFKYAKGKSATLEETIHAQPARNLTLLVGAIAGTYDIIPKSTIPAGLSASNAGSFTYYTVKGDPTSIQTIPRVGQEKYQTYGAYIEGTWQTSSRLKTIFGARVDKDTRLDNVPFLPRFAAVYDLAPNVKIKYTYTRAYIAPAAYFSFATYDNGSLLATSNPEIKPETAISNEVNITYTRNRANLGLSIYSGTQSDLIQVSDAGLPQNIVTQTVYLDAVGTQKRTLVHSVNNGNSRNNGADLFGRLDLGRVNMWFSYSYVDFRESTNGVSSGLSGVSRHNYRLGATFVVSSRFFITPSVVMRSTPSHTTSGVLGDELSNPYSANLHCMYNATKHLEAFLDVTNLTNHKYALTGLVGQAIPQEPVRVSLGARQTF
ncbi:MAG TPA: TonB-dependent receptor [Capsulimonadaceae bacterium]